MKKILTIFSTAILLLFLYGCTASGSSPKSLKEHGLNIAATLDHLAESEEYAKLFTSDAEINSLIEEIGKQDYSTPSVVFQITGVEDVMLREFEQDVTLSQELKDMLGYKFSLALGNMLNSMNGTTYIAAASILMHEESFIFKGLSEPTTYLYVYPGKYGVIVNYNPSEDDIVGAKASFVFNDNFSEIKTVDDATLFFEQMGLTNLEITLPE